MHRLLILALLWLAAPSVAAGAAGGSGRLGAAGHDSVRGARHLPGGGQGRPGGGRQGLRRAQAGRARAGGRPDALRHRVQHQGLHRDRARHPGGRGEGPMGRAGHRLPAVVPDVGPLRHARDDGARSAGAPQRPRASAPGDLLWWPASTYNRKEIAQRLRYMPLATSFRSAYAYDNVCIWSPVK